MDRAAKVELAEDFNEASDYHRTKDPAATHHKEEDGCVTTNQRKEGRAIRAFKLRRRRSELIPNEGESANYQQEPGFFGD